MVGEGVAVLSAVDGLVGPEAGAVHIFEVHAAAPSTGHQHAAVCTCRGGPFTHPGSVYSVCQSGGAPHGNYCCHFW